MRGHRANMVHAGFGARRLPKIKATGQQECEIRHIVDRALVKAKRPEHGTSLKTMFSGDPVIVVEEAVAHLVSQKVYSVSVADFRTMVQGGELRTALERLAKLLPESGSSPPWHQMRAAFTGGDPFAVDLRHNGDDRKDDEWKKRFAPEVLLETVRKYLDLMDSLAEMAKGTRPIQVPEREFVSALETYWTETLKLKASVSRGQSSEPRGDFPDFVRAAAKLYPNAALKESLEADRHAHVALGSLNGHIRLAVDRKGH